IGLSLSERNAVPAVATVGQDGTLELQLLTQPSEQGDVLTIDEDLMLDEQTAKELGVSQMTVKKGDYTVDYSSNPNGTVRLATASGSTSSVSGQVSSTSLRTTLAATASPNPTSGPATLAFTLPSTERVTVTLANAHG